MIYEYAVDPALILAWAQNRRDTKEFSQSFGLGQPRILSGFPKYTKWRSLVLKSIPPDFPPKASKVVEELVLTIGDAIVKRNISNYDGTKNWENNILTDNNEVPFDGIFVTSKDKCPTDVTFEQDDIYSGDINYWDCDRQLAVARTADDMANAVSNMLRLAKHIVFIDPHIKVAPDKLNPFAAYISKSLVNRVTADKPIIEVLYDVNSTRSPSPDQLNKGIKIYLGDNTDKISLTIKQLSEKENGEKLHNRYILTDIGGVSFGTGLDEESGSQTDEITLLDRNTYVLRWEQYVKEKAFDIVSSYTSST